MKNLRDLVLTIAEEEVAKEFTPEQISEAKKRFKTDQAIKQIKSLIHEKNNQTRVHVDAAKLASDNNIVILFGQSDDLMELYGAINDEVYAYGGLSFEEDFDLGNFPEEIYELMKKHKLKLVWCPDKEKSWGFEVSEESVFERFNIMEDGAVFSEGLILVR